jgi:hypothetical protein
LQHLGELFSDSILIDANRMHNKNMSQPSGESFILISSAAFSFCVPNGGLSVGVFIQWIPLDPDKVSTQCPPEKRNICKVSFRFFSVFAIHLAVIVEVIT